ncbi:hypothetical protein Dimus_020858 [Dionaea muscipula]
MEANKNRFIEEWGAGRENLEYNFRWTRRNFALVGIFGIAVPLLVYKGIKLLEFPELRRFPTYLPTFDSVSESSEIELEQEILNPIEGHQSSSSNNNNNLNNNMLRDRVGLLNKQGQPLQILKKYQLKSHIDNVLKHMEEPQKKITEPIPAIDEEDADMSMPISGHLKRMKFVGHGPMGGKWRKINTPAPKKIQAPKKLSPTKSTSSEVSKSAFLSSQYDEEVMDAFWDTLPRVDGTTGSIAVGLSADVVQEEAV